MSSKVFGSFFEVHVVPVLKDNFSYIVRCLRTMETGIVDASQTEPVLAKLKELEVSKLRVLTTHKHWDHSSGNKKLVELYPGIDVYAGSKDDVPCCTKPLNDGDGFSVGDLSVKVMHTPCHTSGHVLFHVFHPTDPNNGAIFTGDTLFIGGIGAFFEGNAAQMLDAMDRIAKLPDNTAVYPGHEYTLEFVRRATKYEPRNEAMLRQLAYYEGRVAGGIPTPPSTIAEEREINVFMRTRVKDLQDACGLTDPVKLMQKLHDDE
jgi:hydroxyacylglutathione hydrolase